MLFVLQYTTVGNDVFITSHNQRKSAPSLSNFLTDVKFPEEKFVHETKMIRQLEYYGAIMGEICGIISRWEEL